MEPGGMLPIGGGDEQFLPKINTNNAQAFSISEEKFARMVETYASFYKSLLEAMYAEANVNPSIGINFNVGIFRIT